MKRARMVVLLLLLLTWSCGKSAPAEEPAREPEARPEQVAEAGGAAEPGGEQPAPSDERAFVGKLVRTVDGGPAGEGEVTFAITADGMISGTIAFGGVSHGLSGLVEGERIRCWLRGGGEAPDGVRRGFLIGDAADGGYKGTFAISGHGGVEPVGGTWTAARD